MDVTWIALGVALAGCASSGASEDAPSTRDAGVLPDVGGGPISELRFAVVGDTRPPFQDDTANYPTAIITKIWQDVEAEVPHPQFAISTGDYMFASPGKSEQLPQLDIYLAARAAFTGLQYPALGNHECTSATTSNCGPGNANGTPRNYLAFMSKMLAPLGVTTPYYLENFSAPDGSWTAKFVFVACNAWSPTQATWLDQVLAEPTTYTFVVRHEGVTATTAPCVRPSSTIIAGHPLTLLIVGHTHTYRHDAATKEVIVGNGGAPLTTTMNYGYAIIARDPAGTVTVTAYDYLTHAVLDTFTIQADGAPG